MGTWEELQYALRHDVPMHIVKMCDAYSEERTKLMLEPRQVELVRRAGGWGLNGGFYGFKDFMPRWAGRRKGRRRQFPHLVFCVLAHSGSLECF
jgi:hypothetical protein